MACVALEVAPQRDHLLINRTLVVCVQTQLFQRGQGVVPAPTGDGPICILPPAIGLRRANGLLADVVYALTPALYLSVRYRRW